MITKAKVTDNKTIIPKNHYRDNIQYHHNKNINKFR